ncbi:MAG TPA: type IV pilus secretin PilQ [Candidatus Omnitrophota bacterium]|nr:type IV pilus secretin PilQ [Candidatus Omnitrophota bacterium]HPD83991.1 type IV pilus secretin PilQ [Candidatus Omnitrophota bacterium]HRZ02848.1 type IV pilus secretin PilQ [Candidatus Omnitrophota bacterium]
MLKKALFLVLILSACVYSYAQDPGVPDNGTSQEAADQAIPAQMGEDVNDAEAVGLPAPEPETKTEVMVTTQPGNVSLDFRDADIRNVLKILSYKSGINIVAGPEVTGLVTIQLTDVYWEQALRVILETYGYGYDKRGNIIVVTTIENLKKRREDNQALAEQEPLATKTFILNYAKAADIVTSIDKMKTSRGSVNFDDRTNALIVRDTPTNLELISKIVPTLDSTTPQVLIEGKIIETTLSNSENLGVDWVVKAGITGPKRPQLWPFTARTDNSKFLPGTFPAPSADLFSYGTLNFTELQAVLELLKTRSNTNILSNPRIVTLDNQKANIVVGTQYPIPTYTYNEEQARLQVSGWSYMDIGIIFDVTPHVNNAGFVTLDIKPKVTSILDYVTVENTQLPRLSTEEASTRVMIKDGETLVIAGLIKSQDTSTRKKIPLLGDVPILGLAFQKSEKSVTKTDLLIFLTPHIITVDKPSGS